MFGTFTHYAISRYLRIDWGYSRMPGASFAVQRRGNVIAFYGFGREFFVEELTAHQARQFVIVLP